MPFDFVAPALASVEITAMVWPTGTTAFSANNIFSSLPATGDGISLSTLSVAISRMVSSRATISPGFLSQRRMVASMMLSPILGMIRLKSAMGQR